MILKRAKFDNFRFDSETISGKSVLSYAAVLNQKTLFSFFLFHIDLQFSSTLFTKVIDHFDDINTWQWYQ